MTTHDPAAIAAGYFDAWKTGDLDGLRTLLAEHATFAGPLGTAEGADAMRDGLAGLAKITTDIVIVKTFVDGPDVLTWFELHTTAATLSPVANLMHVEDGKITKVRTTFDPRPLTNPGTS
jgi:ketosteroid isomerase-like protein